VAHFSLFSSTFINHSPVWVTRAGQLAQFNCGTETKHFVSSYSKSASTPLFITDDYRDIDTYTDRYWYCPARDARIVAAMRMIERECMKPEFNINKLAIRFNLSFSRFWHLFVSNANISPRQFVRQIRLATAKRLLESSFLSVKEIMHFVGYKNISHFTRDYKAEFRLPPVKYRNRFRHPQQR
jgi:transcriptional regulator GlxA family with amidase domain